LFCLININYLILYQTLKLQEFLLITITVLDIIHHPVFYLKHNVSKAEFCLHLQVEPEANLCLQTSATMPIEFKKAIGVVTGLKVFWFKKPYWWCCWCLETETSSLYWANQSRFHLKTETESSLWNFVF
jgi:hypothetical protein